MTFLHFLKSSFQNLIFCEILWLTPRKKITCQRLNFYLKKKPGLLGNYVARCRIIFIVWKNAATVWLIFTLSFCKGIVKDVVKQTIWFLAYWFFEHGIVKQGNRFALKLEKATKALFTGFFRCYLSPKVPHGQDCIKTWAYGIKI